MRQRFGTATEHRPHPRDQLARIERFAKIVVGPDLKADDAVDILLQRGQQNNGYPRALGAQVTAHFESRTVGQHHVEHDEIDLNGGEPFVQLGAIRRQRHAKALALDIAGQELANFRVVVGDENARGCLRHRSELIASF